MLVFTSSISLSSFTNLFEEIILFVIENPIVSLIVLFLFWLLCAVLRALFNQIKRQQIQNSIYDRQFLSYESFESQWIVKKNTKSHSEPIGLKYVDGPGCYVITIYDEPVRNNDYRNYQNIYIGQSINMCQRVHNHFTGKGNGDVYADIKYGKYVYVCLIKCNQSELNRLEKSLIAAFKATNSYNRTKGGA